MGLADSLGFGKTATFQATVILHELNQVPLLNAKFRCKWKFKDATHSSGHASDDTSSGAHAQRAATGFAGVTERFLHPRSALSSSSTPTPNGNERDRSRDARSMSRSRSGSPHGIYSSEDGEDFRSPNQSPPLSPEARTPNPNRTPGPGSSSAFPFTSPFSGNAETLYATPSTRTATYDSGATTTSPDGPDSAGASSRRRGAGDLSALSTGAGGGPATAHRPEPKGTTTFIPLRAHTAVFNREIMCPVQISLRHLPGSSKYQLQPSPVRLAIKQEVLSEDGKREEERLGEIILDLSQFAAHTHKSTEDVRPRRYLLQDCKSNAVLRVSVKMEWLEGEKHFVVPPFRTGQISNAAPAAKGLGSGKNSPATRSSASLAHKATSTASSSTRLSSSSYARSTTASTTSMHRCNSTSSAGSLRTPGSATPAPGTKHAPRRPKRTWHPASALALTASGLPSAGLAPSVHAPGASRAADRSAAEIVEGIFNRPPLSSSRRGSAEALAALGGEGDDQDRDEPRARDMVDAKEGALGEPFELRGKGAGGRMGMGMGMGRTRRAAAAGQPASKAWSICSFGRERDKPSRGETAPPPAPPGPASYARAEAPAEAERKRDRARRLRDVTHGHLLGRNGGGGGEGRADPPKLDVHVQPPTPQPGLVRSASHSGSATPHRPPSLASSVSSATKPLSVRWGDQSTASSSAAATPPASSPASSVPSPASADRRSLRAQRSGDSLRSTASAGGAGLGFAIPERDRDSLARPASRASFNSVVTPPSPERKETPRPRPASGAGERKKLAFGAGARKDVPGERAPGGGEWGRSWG
ncbi:hypothetical protein JCM10450v2_003782 [Rhodotorula kratochvilovae]